MSIHMGEIIKKRAQKMNVGPTRLAGLINTSKQNVYGIFKRKSIDSELLLHISVALEYDFFREYTASVEKAAEPGHVFRNSPQIELRKLKEEVSQLQKSLEELQEKYDMLKKINTLLEGKSK